MYKLVDNGLIREYNGQVIIGNNNNGMWVRVSKEKLKEIIRNLNSKDDEYIRSKYMSLVSSGIIVDMTEKNKTGKIESIMIAVTNRCNLQCIHCGFEAGPNETDEIPTEIVKSVIIGNSQTKEFIITGGEPLVHEGFSEIARCLRENFKGRCILMTNGTLINVSNIEEIKDTFDEVSISIDGATPDTCDRMRGAGVFHKVMNSIKMLHNVGVSDISLSMTVTDYNDKQEKEFVDLCEHIGVEPILRDLFLMGRAKKNMDRLDRDREKIASNISLDNIEEECKKIKLNGKCQAGKNSFYIQYDQSVYPCAVAAINPDFRMAKIDKNNSDLSRIIKEKCGKKGLREFMNISPKIIPECKDCSVNDFCWGCIQEYYTYIKDPTNFKVFCDLQKTNLKKVIWRE